MRALVLERPCPVADGPLAVRDVPVPAPAADELLLRVSACGVCRTDLQLAEGDLVARVVPIIPGHQIVGRVEAVGTERRRLEPWRSRGSDVARRGLWICRRCREGRENLCAPASFTGWDRTVASPSVRRCGRASRHGCRMPSPTWPRRRCCAEASSATAPCGSAASSPAAGSGSSGSAPPRAARSRSPCTGAARCSSAPGRRRNVHGRSSSVPCGPVATTKPTRPPGRRDHVRPVRGRRGGRAALPRPRREGRGQRDPSRSRAGVPLRPPLVGAQHLQRRERHAAGCLRVPAARRFDTGSRRRGGSSPRRREPSTAACGRRHGRGSRRARALT